MKFLIIGLGSMGKRRVRCLQALGYMDITGFDPREDRREEAARKYGITVTHSLDTLDLDGFDAFIVSTPPDRHTPYVKLAIDHRKPCFIEASVLLEDVREIERYNRNNTFIAPSCTLRFHPMIKDITSIIRSGKYGKITNFTYHSGQYLPDWHPWEKVTEFYVGNRATGGGREIVPFELTWIVDSIGWPDAAKGVFEQTINFGAQIEDSYAFTLRYPDKVGAIIVDVASRYAVRNLVINLETAQIQWRWDDGFFRIYEIENGRWIQYGQPEFHASDGYNKNIGEEMYIDEIRHFIGSFTGTHQYPNTIADDIRVLEILEQIENSDGGYNR
ncbi:Gfo/Idh/MocA family oxidoreductase [uncultured Rikenella sp.]|uniref:Gfo/Idh/MocA family protein n=1 Tax=uncultured Rikenella sp. TaxID=368003 RepID=UPI002610AF20|nr:Gfo/Idh/MocA family oxidoreductase [uncultured Rikenella sp.]